MTTTIVTLRIENDNSSELTTSDATERWREIIDILIQQSGFQRCHCGHELENRNNIRMYIDWDNIEASRSFMQSPDYDRFGRVLQARYNTNGISFSHCNYNDHPPLKFLNKVDSVVGATEVLTLFFPKDYTDSDKEAFENAVKKLVDVMTTASDVAGFHGGSTGWIKELQKKPEDASGNEFLAFNALVGWTDIPTHQAARESKTFKENFGILRDAKDLRGVHVVHFYGEEAKGGSHLITE